jgi:transposase
MTTRWRFTADLRPKVALEALPGDRTILEIAGQHKVYPNQVSTWKRQAMCGLGLVFSNGVDKASVNYEGEIHDLQAKIRQLTMERDVLARGPKW